MSADYSLTRKEKPITIDGKPHVIVQASAGTVRDYRNAIARTTKFGPEGKPQSVEGMADTDLLLVSRCLFSINGDGQRAPVTLPAIESWPDTFFREMLDECEKISELGDYRKKPEENGQAAKNSQTATATS